MYSIFFNLYTLFEEDDVFTEIGTSELSTEMPFIPREKDIVILTDMDKDFWHGSYFAEYGEVIEVFYNPEVGDGEIVIQVNLEIDCNDLLSKYPTDDKKEDTSHLKVIK